MFPCDNSLIIEVLPKIDELNTVTVIENTDAINSTDVADKQTATDSYPIDIDSDDDQSISNADTTRQQNNEDLAKIG